MYAKDKFGHGGGGGGGKHFSKTFFSIFYVLNSKNRISTNIFNRSLSNIFADNLRVESTIIFMEKMSFSLKLCSGIFYGQSFIKIVQGPLEI